MPAKGLNNQERHIHKELKQLGFHIFYQETNNPRSPGDWWATHVELIGQYHLPTGHKAAIDALEKVRANNKPTTGTSANQLLLFGGQ